MLVLGLLGRHDDAKFATRLNGEGLFYTGVAEGHIFHFANTLQVAFVAATSAWARAADGVTSLDDGAQQGSHFDLVVVGTYGVAHFRMLSVLFAQLQTQQSVWSLFVVVGTLSNVVQQTRALGQLHVQAHFSRHGGTQTSYFT